MSDVVVNVDLASPADENRLALAINAFAKRQSELMDTGTRLEDGPGIMVKTAMRTGSVRKILTFQDREWAAIFLQLWRSDVLRGGSSAP